MSWTRYEGKALADTTLNGGALLAELEGYIRVHNPHLTDVRVEQATATEGVRHGCPTAFRAVVQSHLLLADNGQGH